MKTRLVDRWRCMSSWSGTWTVLGHSFNVRVLTDRLTRHVVQMRKPEAPEPAAPPDSDGYTPRQKRDRLPRGVHNESGTVSSPT